MAKIWMKPTDEMSLRELELATAFVAGGVDRACRAEQIERARKVDALARVLIDARDSRRALYEAVEDALVGAYVKVCLDDPELDENTA